MNDQFVITKRQKTTALVIMNNPKTLNAMDQQMGPALLNALEELAHDNAIKAVVLTGAGGIFSAGGNLKKAQKHLANHPEQGASPVFEAYTIWVHRVLEAICNLEKPVFSAVTGVASGAGLAWMLASDFVVADPLARIKPGFIGVGLVAAAGVTWHLPKLTGLKKATELLMLNQALSPEEALKLGLVQKISSSGQARKEALCLAFSLAQGPQKTLAETKRLLNENARQGIFSHVEAEKKAVLKLADSGEFARRLEAFMSRKKS